jgi:asparagine synthase (glutamine-hydrolysing)
VILREALADVLPEEVARRTDKIGFATPERDWLRGRLGRLAREVVASPSFAERGYVDQGKALEHLDRVAAGRAPFDFRIWRWLNLELWLRAYVDRAPSPVAG